MAAHTERPTTTIITGINVTPLVDIMLVLLIIFMLTANLIAKQAIEVELPKASTGEASEPTTVALTLTKERRPLPQRRAHRRGGAARPTCRASSRATRARRRSSPPTRRSRTASVIWLIDLVRTAGIFKFALNIDPAAVEASRP